MIRCPGALASARSALTAPHRIQATKAESSAVDAALAHAERKGFRLAVIGRTCALIAIIFFYLTVLRYPNNIYVAGLLLAIAAVGAAPLALIGGRYERMGRYAFFAFDAAAISAMLVLAPPSRRVDIPQNLVFFSSRTENYYVLVAISVLALSPALVSGLVFCALAGLAGATAWIMAGIEHTVSIGELPLAPLPRGLPRRRSQPQLPQHPCV